MAKNYGGRSEKNGSMPNGDMAMAGVDQGDMSPRIKDYQRPTKDFSQEGFNKTLDYIERQDRMQSNESSTIDKQAYKGRYS